MAVELNLVAYQWSAVGVESLISTLVLGTVIEYLPASPPERVVWTQGPDPGAWPVETQVENSVDTVRLSATSPHSLLSDIKERLKRARLWAEGLRGSGRVMVRFRDTDVSATWYEARLFGGRVKLGQGPYLTLTLERAPYWSAPETVVNVANISTGLVYQGSAAVRNRDDATGSNWVKLAGFTGDVPAAMRITVEDGDIGVLPDNLGEVRIGWDVDQYTTQLEGEDSVLAKVVTGSASYSNNAYATASAFQWNVNVQYIGAYKLLAKGDLSAGSWYATMGYDATVYTGRTVPGVSGWTDFGMVVLPPGGKLHSARRPFFVKLTGSAGGDLDFLLLMPLRQWRRLSFMDSVATASFVIEDDVFRDETAMINNSLRDPNVDGWGRRIRLWPVDLLPSGANQMLVFTLEDTSGVVSTVRTATVIVYARLRYAVIP